MKFLLLVLVTLTLTACSSAPTKIDLESEKIVEHMSKPRRVVGPDFDARFEKDGLIGGEFVAIASITDRIDKNEASMQVLAEASARSRLLNSAPTEFKKVIQSAISSSMGDNGSVENIGITITEVMALTGLTSTFNDTQCVKYIVPNHNMSYDYSKECRVIVRVPASELMKAYNYTLDKKYGVKEQNAIQDLLKKQLTEKLLDPSRASASKANAQ